MIDSLTINFNNLIVFKRSKFVPRKREKQNGDTSKSGNTTKQRIESQRKKVLRHNEKTPFRYFI